MDPDTAFYSIVFFTMKPRPFFVFCYLLNSPCGWHILCYPFMSSEELTETLNTAFYCTIFFSIKRRLFLVLIFINSFLLLIYSMFSLCEQWGADRDDSAGGGEHSGRAHSWRGQTGQSTFQSMSRIRIHLFLGLPDPDPLVRGMDPDPEPSIIKQK